MHTTVWRHWRRGMLFHNHCDCCCRLSVVQTRNIVVPTATNVTCRKELVTRLHVTCHGMQWLWARWSECCPVMLCVLVARRNVLMDKPAVYWTQDYMAAAVFLRYCMIFPLSCRSTHWFLSDFSVFLQEFWYNWLWKCFAFVAVVL